MIEEKKDSDKDSKDKKPPVDLRRENGPEDKTDLKPNEIYDRGLADSGDAQHSHGVS